jgi:plastocyanin
VAESVEFEPASVTASAGEVSVHIDNRDPVRHTFAIDELGVETEIPAGKGRRVTFDAGAGEYEFHCTVPGHEDMKGTITVE